MQKVNNQSDDSGVRAAIGLISNKWKLYIMHELLSGKKRFGELRKRVNGISQKVLTDNLRSMEHDGLLTRKVYAEIPPRVEYELSELGLSFSEVLRVVDKWGDEYLKTYTPPKK
jgi:DNA-binding HxlR family transcriptional regulator